MGLIIPHSDYYRVGGPPKEYQEYTMALSNIIIFYLLQDVWKYMVDTWALNNGVPRSLAVGSTCVMEWCLLNPLGLVSEVCCRVTPSQSHTQLQHAPASWKNEGPATQPWHPGTKSK